MTRKVWKVPAAPAPGPQIRMFRAKAATPLTIGPSRDGMSMWVEVTDPDRGDSAGYGIDHATPGAECQVEYAVLGTGWPIPEGFEYLSTYTTPTGYVWHLYVRP